MEAIQVAALAAGTLGAGLVGAVALTRPDLNFQERGASGCSVAAGTFGGGDLPTNPANPKLSLALALVPIGMIALAVFPPFVRCVQSA